MGKFKNKELEIEIKNSIKELKDVYFHEQDHKALVFFNFNDIYKNKHRGEVAYSIDRERYEFHHNVQAWTHMTVYGMMSEGELLDIVNIIKCFKKY